MLDRLRALFRVWRGAEPEAREIEDELRSHREHRADDLERAGLSRAEAERQAGRELGAPGAYEEECREARGLRFFDELRQDCLYAARTLRRDPGFALVAILSLALGLGANTVVFGVMNALVMAPLPVAAPSALYFVQSSSYPSHSYPNYRDLRDRNVAFSGLAAYRIAPMGVETAEGAQRLWGYLATGNYFDVLGVKPVLGRFFHAEDDAQAGASPFAVLSHAAWRGRFGADPEIAGKSVRINGQPYTVLGVAPADFRGTELFYWSEVWVPMAMQPQIEGRSWLEDRYSFNSWVVGRVRPGVTRDQAEANLNQIAKDLAHEHPDANKDLALSLARPGLVGDALRGPVQAFTAGVMAMAGLVLLASCANLAALMGARTADRHRELAIRLSIGAGRMRVVRQLLTEAVFISVTSAAAGCALAFGVLHVLSGWRAPVDFPVRLDLDPDWRAFGFSAAAALLAGLLFGLAPARQAWRVNPNQMLKGAATGPRGVRGWAIRDVLLAGQVALCCALVAACFVSLRGLGRALATPVGFEQKGVAVAAFDLALARYSPEAGAAFQRRAIGAVQTLPGVTSAAYANSLPLSIDESSTTVFPPGTSDFNLASGVQASYYQVSPGYFRTAGTRLLSGRDFDWQARQPRPTVAIVNEAFARQVFGSRDAVGLRFANGRSDPWVEVIGMVEDGKYTTLTEEPRAAVFWPALQSYNSTTVLLVRTTRPETEMAGQMRATLSSLDPTLPVYGVGSWTQMLGFALLPARVASVALSAFGLLAVMLACTGIYGSAAYAVSRRVREIGIRVAVGAGPWAVLRFALGRAGQVVLLGAAVGLLLGLASERIVSSIVYQASVHDPGVLAAVTLTMGLVGLASAWVPAMRALSLDPIRALRQN